MKYSFHPEAHAEYRDAALYYEEHRQGLGEAFVVEVEATIARILDSPHRWRRIAPDIRSCRTRTFPYAVLYSIEGDFILVTAVMHLRRKPGYWVTRRHDHRSGGE